MLAQFANVGAQATLWGYFVDFKLDFARSAHFAPVIPYAEFWQKSILHQDTPITAEQMAGFHASFALVLFMLGRFLGTYLMSRMDARKVLSWYCIAAVVLVALAFATGGIVGIYLHHAYLLLPEHHVPHHFCFGDKRLGTCRK